MVHSKYIINADLSRKRKIFKLNNTYVSQLKVFV